MSLDIAFVVRELGRVGGRWARSPCGIEDEVADELPGRGVDDPPVQVVDEEQDVGAGKGSADAQWEPDTETAAQPECRPSFAGVQQRGMSATPVTAVVACRRHCQP
jgi:hypothetical protein